ncbi:MAG: cyanoglobin [Bacteroidetes bacterium]|nr:cyanoglobin [Bacteroidota bacterium]MDA1268245.1 cyanoglobin [Bacteroidota bacterium]
MKSLDFLYSRIIEASLKELAGNFYQEISKITELRSLCFKDLEADAHRIYLFHVQTLGGPQTYSDERGHCRLRIRHMQWKFDSKMRVFWMNAMLHAPDKVHLEREVHEELLHYFIQVANAMTYHD